MDAKDRWKRENTKLYQLRIAYSSGVPAAIEKACQDSGSTPAEYMREALLEKLDFDGYIRMEVVKQRRARRKPDNLIEE